VDRRVTVRQDRPQVHYSNSLLLSNTHTQNRHPTRRKRPNNNKRPSLISPGEFFNLKICAAQWHSCDESRMPPREGKGPDVETLARSLRATRIELSVCPKYSINHDPRVATDVTHQTPQIMLCAIRAHAARTKYQTWCVTCEEMDSRPDRQPLAASERSFSSFTWLRQECDWRHFTNDKRGGKIRRVAVGADREFSILPHFALLPCQLESTFDWFVRPDFAIQFSVSVYQQILSLTFRWQTKYLWQG